MNNWNEPMTNVPLNTTEIPDDVLLHLYKRIQSLLAATASYLEILTDMEAQLKTEMRYRELPTESGQCKGKGGKASF